MDTKRLKLHTWDMSALEWTPTILQAGNAIFSREYGIGFGNHRSSQPKFFTLPPTSLRYAKYNQSTDTPGFTTHRDKPTFINETHSLSTKIDCPLLLLFPMPVIIWAGPVPLRWFVPRAAGMSRVRFPSGVSRAATTAFPRAQCISYLCTLSLHPVQNGWQQLGRHVLQKGPHKLASHLRCEHHGVGCAYTQGRTGQLWSCSGECRGSWSGWRHRGRRLGLGNVGCWLRRAWMNRRHRDDLNWGWLVLGHESRPIRYRWGR